MYMPQCCLPWCAQRAAVCRACAMAVLLILAQRSALLAQDVTQPSDPVVPSSANSPANEGVRNALDDLTGTKYLNLDKLNTGLTVWPQAGFTRVTGIGLISANDAAERDPASFVLEGSNNAGQTWSAIATGVVPAFPARFYEQDFSFSNSQSYATYRVTFPTVANPGAANSMQIADVELFGEVLPTVRTDITRAGDPLFPSSTNSPGAEGVANAIDNTLSTKYLNLDKLNTGFTVWPQAGFTRVTGIGLSSANDWPERDPASFVLEGSDDAGQTWSAIATGVVPGFANRYTEQDIFFRNDRTFATYRVTFPDVANAGAANSMQVAEVQLFGEFMPTPRTDVTQPGDPITPTSANSPGGEGVTNAIDDTAATKYLNLDKLNTGFTVWPQAGMTRVTGIGLTSANDWPERDPASFVLEGSNDGGATFAPVAAGMVPGFASRFQERDIFFANAEQYGVYRLVFPTIVNEGATNSMQIAEVQLFGDVSPAVRTDVTQPGDPLIPSSTNSPGGEVVANAIDDTFATKYLNFDKSNTGFTIWPQLGFTTVTGLGLTSANDAPERDPANYVLEGSNDGGNTFVQIAAGSLPGFSARQQTRDVFFANGQPYAMYRVTFPDVVNPGAASSMQVAEVQLYGDPGDTPRIDVTKPSDPIVPSSANSPANEGVRNAIDDTAATKYLNLDKLATGFTVWPQAGFTRVRGIGLTSANDAPERDPARYVVEGSNDGGQTFTQIAAGVVPAFTTRYQERDLFFANDQAYGIYRVTFPDVADSGAASSMQIAEVDLFGDFMPTMRTDVTQPGDPIWPTSANSPGNEGVANAIDNTTTTKYLNFDKLNTGFTVEPSMGRSLVQGLGLTSANDWPERDPASFMLEGSRDGGRSFSLIAAGDVPPFSGRFTQMDIFFSNTTGYDLYRLIFPDVANAGATDSMQIAEVQLYGVSVPEPSSLLLVSLAGLGVAGWALRRRRGRGGVEAVRARVLSNPQRVP